MNKLTIAIATLVALFAGGLAIAQSAPASKPAGHHARMGRMARFLELTDQQRQQIRQIMKQAREDAQKAPDQAARREIKRAAMEKIKTDVLTEDQRAKLQKVHRGMMARHVFAQLNLTDEQKAKVRDIMKSARADAAKATDQAARKEVWKNAFGKIKADVLTDAQRKQLEEMKARHRQHSTTASAPAK